MHPNLKKILRSLSLDIRHTLEGSYDAAGVFHPGDLETRLNELGVWRERTARPLAELPHLSAEDRAARQVIDAYIAYRAEAGVERAEAVAEFVREAAYNWANRLLALRCMEARGIIDEVVLQKTVYGGRSLVHNRLAKKDPEACSGPDEGLFAVLLMEFQARAEELPELFAPNSPAIALRPSLPALKRVIGLLSGTFRVNGQETANDEVFSAADALGWAYQYWNSEEKDRVFEKVRTQKGAKIEGADIIPATQLYTEPFMVKFLVQNSLGTLWMGMHPESNLAEGWEYYVKDADCTSVERKPVQAVTLLDPACGSGHFLLEALDLLFSMYQEDDASMTEADIAASILNHNLYGIDIDERAVQIAAAALWMKAKEVAPDLLPAALTDFHHHLVATNIRLPKGMDHLKAFLAKHPEDAPLQSALEVIFDGLENVHELGSLIQIEEPVEKELHYLREKYESIQKRGIQPSFFETVVVQGELPLGLENYDQWKAKILTQVEQHFLKETVTSSSIQVFFGQSAIKSISLFEIISQRYDVIATNPPYMGLKNMGPTLRSYSQSTYSRGKHNLYSCFMDAAINLSKKRGIIAFVTLDGWLTKKLFTSLRENILSNCSLSLLALLGRHAFSDADPPGLPILFTFQKVSPKPDNKIFSYRLPATELAEAQSTMLKNLIHDKKVSIVQQFAINQMPQSAILSWLPKTMLNVFSKFQLLSSTADCVVGLQTGNTPRFVRYLWETPYSNRWMPYVQGGAFKKWFGLEQTTFDWRKDGIFYRESTSARWNGAGRFFEPGLTYTESSRGSLSLRLMTASGFSQSGSAVLPRDSSQLNSLAGVLSSRVASLFSRLLRPGRVFPAGYMSLMPLPPNVSSLEVYTNLALILKKSLVQDCLLERSFVSYLPTDLCSLGEYIKRKLLTVLKLETLLSTVEGEIENTVMSLYGLDTEAIDFVLIETGIPSGLFPLILEYMSSPGYDSSSETFDMIIQNRIEEKRIKELGGLKENLKNLFEYGPEIDSESKINDGGDDEEDSDQISNAHIPVPSETFIDDLSQKLQVHPISIFLMLKEGIEKEGWQCPIRYRVLVEDTFTILVLTLLGYRWPKQIEAREPIPAWADPDGIIPLTPGLKDLPLLERMCAHLPEQFPGGNVTALEHEFSEIMGEPLEKWLSSSFFKHHISQFKKRPIAWQFISQPANEKDGKGKGGSSRKKGLDKAPAFSCLVYYHKLNAGTLTTIKSQYVSPLRQSYETELRTLDGIVLLSPDQSSRRLQLEAWIDELKEFEDRLERCAREGFASPALAQVSVKEPIDRWVSRDGMALPPANRAEFEAQEMRYDPDLNDGVRVNIAPMQKYGLLAADVLDAKDIEKAIADRAEWRADERRWCREGKLPKPGWWK